MEVVLRSDVEHCGLRGEVVNVARGYARNFLLPRGLAEVATPGLKRELERRDALKSRSEAKDTGEAEAIAKRLEANELKFEVNAGPSGALFGSVTATNIVDRLWEEQKIRIDRRKLGMQTIKRIGRYTVDAEVFTDVHAGLRILVVPEGGELPPDEPEVTETPEAATDAAAATGAAPAEAAAGTADVEDAAPAAGATDADVAEANVAEADAAQADVAEADLAEAEPVAAASAEVEAPEAAAAAEPGLAEPEAV